MSSSIISVPTTQKVVLIDGIGGLDNIKYVDFPVPKIGGNEILIKNRYVGINFIESYFRKGIYPCELPYVLGREATGSVVAKGDNVTKFEIGDKVAYFSGSTFAQYTKVLDSGVILKLPKEVSDDKMKIVSAALLQGFTALTLSEDAYKVQKGDTILVYAAAGGVGLILLQLLKRKGAHSIAVVSTDEKAALARKNGAEFTVNSSKEDIETAVRKITNGEGVEAAFDSIGRDTFDTTLALLKRKGTFVSYGNASGVVPPLSITRLTPKNIKLVRPQVFGYISDAKDLKHYSDEFFKLIDSGELNILIHKVYSLQDYKEATKELEGRKTVGKLLLEIS